MQKYKQYCPVARASEILADRWTPLIVRELILGSHRFNEIERGLPRISRSLLASMAYHLSEAGKDLKTVIETRGAWGVRWAFWRAEAGGVGRGVIDLEDSPADQSRALAGTAYGRGVRFHRSSGTTSVVAPRASGRCRCRLACIGTSRSGIYLRPRLSMLRC